MKNKKTSVLFAIIFLIGIGVYNLCAFMLADDYTNKFWTVYVFTMAAFLIQIIIPLVIFLEERKRNSGYMKLPIFFISNSYFVVQLIVGIWFMCHPVTYRFTFAIEIILSTVFIILILAVSIEKERVAVLESEKETSVYFIKNLTLQAEYLYNKTSEQEKQTALKKLYEVIRFSDPVSSNAVLMLNEQITAGFQSIENGLDKKNCKEISKEVEAVIDLLNRRNVICKANK